MKIDSILFTNLNITNPTVTKNHFLFYNRKFNDYGPTWKLIKNGADKYFYGSSQNNSLSINTLDAISDFGQILIIDSSFVDTSFKLSNNNNLCVGDSVNIILHGGNKYQWLKDGSKITVTNDTLLTIKESGIYRCLISSPTNFVDTTSSIDLRFNKIPTTPMIIRDSLTYLKSNNYFGNLWYKDGSLIADTSSRIKPSIQGSYTVKTTQNGCSSALSIPYYYLVTDIINLSSDEYIKLSPNPFNNQLNFDFVVKGYQRLNIEVFDIATGSKKAMMQNLTPGVPLYLGQLSAGTYFIKVSSNDGKINYQFKMIKL